DSRRRRRSCIARTANGNTDSEPDPRRLLENHVGAERLRPPSHAPTSPAHLTGLVPVIHASGAHTVPNRDVGGRTKSGHPRLGSRSGKEAFLGQPVILFSNISEVNCTAK